MRFVFVYLLREMCFELREMKPISPPKKMYFPPQICGCSSVPVEFSRAAVALSRAA